ncbi:MAG: hypothetical protein LBB81_01720, partial [Treponema sp.]|nr:hypothetical protein [Treponema sp.]
MNFIEPEEQQTVPVSVILENLSISPENKEWLLSLLLENEILSEMQSDFENSLGGLVKECNEKDSSSFRALFLFGDSSFYKFSNGTFSSYGILSVFSDCVNEKNLSRE